MQSRYYDPVTCKFINIDEPTIIASNPYNIMSVFAFDYCNNNPVMYVDKNGYVAANIIGAVIGAIVGAVGGSYLSNWLADKIGLGGWKRKVFVWGLSAVITASASAIGYVIGPYVAKVASKLTDYVVKLINNGKISLKSFSASVRDSMGITKSIVNKLINNANKLKLTNTVKSHIASRPYIKSTFLIQNIMRAGKPVADSSLKNGLKWIVYGSWNGTYGKWELVIDVATQTIVHFLFRK